MAPSFARRCEGCGQTIINHPKPGRWVIVEGKACTLYDIRILHHGSRLSGELDGGHEDLKESEAHVYVDRTPERPDTSTLMGDAMSKRIVRDII